MVLGLNRIPCAATPALPSSPALPLEATAMANDAESPRSRRALLVAIAGAGAATVASALGRPLPANAEVGDNLFTSTNAMTALTARNTGPMGGVAFIAYAATGPAIAGTSNSQNGTLQDV